MQQNELNIVKSRIRRAGMLLRLADLIPFLLFLAATLAGAFLLYFLFDYLTGFPRWIRLAVSLALLVFIFIYLPKRHRFPHFRSNADSAAAIEEFALRRLPDGFHAMLISSVEFGEKAGQSGRTSAELRARVVRDAARKNFDPLRLKLFDRKKLRLAILTFILAAAAWGALALFAPAPTSIFWRRTIGLDAKYPTHTRIESIEAAAFVERFEPFEIRVAGGGILPRRGRVRIEPEDGKAVYAQLEADENAGRGHYRTIVNRPSKSFRFKVYLGDDSSEERFVEVIPPPMTTGGTIKIQPPAYTGRKTMTCELGPAEAPEGSRLEFTVRTDREVAKAMLRFSDGTALAGRIDGTACLFQPFELKKDMSCRVELEDAHGIGSRIRIDYPLSAVPDKLPAIAVELPENGSYYSPARGIPCRLRVSDDFGVARVAYRYEIKRRVRKGDYEETLSLEKGRGELAAPTDKPLEIMVSHILNVRDLEKLAPGCTVSFVFTASDAKEPARRAPEAAEGESEVVEINFVSDQDLRKLLQLEELRIYQNLNDVVEDMKNQRAIIEAILKKEKQP